MLPSSGMAALVKSTFMLHHHVHPPNALLQILNPNCAMIIGCREKLAFPTGMSQIKKDHATCGVTNIAYSGQLVHFVVQPSQHELSRRGNFAGFRRKLFLIGSKHVAPKWGHANADDVNEAPSMSEDSCAHASSEVNEMLTQAVQDIAGHVDLDAPLMELGIDSLGAAEISSRMSTLLNQALAPTLIFNFPSVRQLGAHLETMSTGKSASALLCTRKQLAQSTTILRPTILGVALTLPRGLAGRDIACACDGMHEVPVERWEVFVPHPSELVRGRVRHGGFIRAAALFDAGKFRVSAAEAISMDPQQRLLLEHTETAAIATGRDHSSDGHIGIFVGITSTEYGAIVSNNPLANSVYASTASSLSVASGRISFALNLHGPCVSYETACSASLVANHGSMRALQLNECVLGLAAGVNLLLLPGSSFGAAVAGMTSARGRSHTFDARADGYARGEACGGVALGGGNAGLSLHGSAVRQDGRSASLTAPNGQAQQGLLTAALNDASTTADELAISEAHGTGTALGDPIEAGSLAAAVLSARDDALAVGGVKANIGHAEPAAGMTGLLKLALGLRACEAAANAQLRSLNPHVGDTLRSVVGAPPVQLAALVGGGKMAGGVSSFGYSGTIVHAMLAFKTGGKAFTFGCDSDSSLALAFCSRGADAAGEPLPTDCSQMDAGRSTFEPRSIFGHLYLYRRRAFPWRESANSSREAEVSPYTFKQHTSPTSGLVRPECASRGVLATAQTTTRRERTDQEGTFVQLSLYGTQIVIQLDDPKQFNTFSNALGEDMRRAVQHVSTVPDVASVVLQGAGPHFSVGGNPYAMRGSHATSPAAVLLRLRELYNGFLKLRTLPHPVVGAVHGALVGGGVAGCLHVDYLAADHASTFEHGNLVRGVCVLGMLSKTFAIALGAHAQHVYLQNARLDTTAARAAGLVHQLCAGVTATQTHSRQVAGLAAHCRDLSKAVTCHRAAIDLAVLAREAVGHAECQVANGGFAKSSIQTHSSVAEGSLRLQAVVDSGSPYHRRAPNSGLSLAL